MKTAGQIFEGRSPVDENSGVERPSLFRAFLSIPVFILEFHLGVKFKIIHIFRLLQTRCIVNFDLFRIARQEKNGVFMFSLALDTSDIIVLSQRYGMGTWKTAFLQIFFLQTIVGTFPKPANVTKAWHQHARHPLSQTCLKIGFVDRNQYLCSDSNNRPP